MSQRWFSVAQVNDLLPELNLVVRRILALRQEVSRKSRHLHARRAEAPPDSDFMQPEAELDFLVTVLKSLYARVEELGGVIKHPDATLVDFPGRDPDGADVWLCWKYGEESIAYYHPLDQGFADRRPVQPGM